VLHPCSSFTAVCHAAAAGVPMAASDRGNVFASPVKVCPCTGTVVGCTGVLPVQGLYPWTNDLLKTVRRYRRVCYHPCDYATVKGYQKHLNIYGSSWSCSPEP
jgi:hypothetical protein